jgi:hypothetical protein
MNAKIVLLIITFTLSLTGCKPDLTVTQVDVNWVGGHWAKAEIKNIGKKDAGPFLVYFNGVENPISPNHRPQVSVEVPGLAKGVSTWVDADFGPKAHVDNDSLANIFEVLVIADPKNAIAELKEDNNQRSAPVP